MIDPVILQTVAWAASLCVALMAIGSAAMKLWNPPAMNAKWNQQLGMPDSLRVWAAGVEIAAAVLFLFPRTAMVGAILLTAYLGGAIALHARVKAFPFVVYASVIIGLIWAVLSVR
ncbi:MAG: DoxX family protein [Rhodopirellula sp. JB044]|uniref:DoxX family protein n=1 Tax=Rhodopirellula sp. JB044 TaxID=3342844 RepID=UPI00370BCE16